MSKYILIDIGGTSIKTAYYDGELSKVKEYPTNAKKGVAVVIDTVKQIIESYNDYDAIGISTAGQVNSEEGYIIYANENMPGYTGTKWKQMLENEFKKPVYVENDVNAAALGEGLEGSASGKNNYLCLTYGTGVGGAIVIDSKVFHGASGSAGEFGAMLMHASKHVGKDPYAGGYEKYGSTTALVNKAISYNPDYNNGRIIMEHLDDQNVEKILDDWCNEIALGLTSLIHIFNPELVILGGGIMEQELVFNKVKEKVSGYIMPSFSCVELKQAKLGNKAGLYGALSLILQSQK